MSKTLQLEKLDLLSMKDIEQAYDDIPYQMPWVDFKGQMDMRPEKGMNWQNLASDFIFKPRTPFIRSSIRMVNEAKKMSETEYKCQID